MLRTAQLTLQAQRAGIDKALESISLEMVENAPEKEWLKKGMAGPSSKVDKAVAEGERDSVTSPSSLGQFSGEYSSGPHLTSSSEEEQRKGEGRRRRVVRQESKRFVK